MAGTGLTAHAPDSGGSWSVPNDAGSFEADGAGGIDAAFTTVAPYKYSIQRPANAPTQP